MSCPVALLVTCEHGGNRVPRAYRGFFGGGARALRSHRGFDPGALDMARYLSRRLEAPLQFATVTRLLVDLNRSLGHPAHFSAHTRVADPATRAEILHGFYHPYRSRVESRIAELVSDGMSVLHVASHSFTPVLDGRERGADVAWLYDPGRVREKGICSRWLDELKALRPDLRLRRNYPYRGTDDGLTTHLRRSFPVSRYFGVELEVNQRWFLGDRREWLRVRSSIAEALASVMTSTTK